MKKIFKKIIFYTMAILLFSCTYGLNKVNCISTTNTSITKKEILNKIDSIMMTFDSACRKYKVVSYKCESDSILEVKTKTKCDEKYFLFNKDIKFLKVITVLEEVN